MVHTLPKLRAQTIRKYTYDLVAGAYNGPLSGSVHSLQNANIVYAFLKNLHVALAALTLSGFLLRAWWMLMHSDKLQLRAVRILPHIVDTLFLVSGIGLIFALRLPLAQSPWLIAKLVALVVYIVAGAIALKRGRTMRVRVTALAIALLAFGYIVGAAISKSAQSWLAVF